MSRQRLRARLRSRLSSARRWLRALRTRFSPSEAQHLFALTLGVGIVCGFVAVAFHQAIGLAERLLVDRATAAGGVVGALWLVAAPALGGLVVGVVLTRFLPSAAGSGIPQVKLAFAVADGRVRFRDAFGKFFLVILQIGSGASLGREGPTVQICAGAASRLARWTSLPPKSARRLTAVGVAAGIAAAFNAPIAAVTFTIEEIVGKLDGAILSGAVVAAALAAVIERSILGTHPVIEAGGDYTLTSAASLPFYALLGIIAALVAVAFTDGLLGLRRWFRERSGVPPWLRPALGGLMTGALAMLFLTGLETTGITGGGYRTLGRALTGQIGLVVLLCLCVGKCLATIFSYSSGGAGGIFAPTLFIGAMLGGAVGYVDVAALHHAHLQIGAFALVGMGAVFAGVIRAPMTSVLIIFEMTGSYGLVLPLMLANAIAYILARRWRPLGIYEALLAQDGLVLPTEAPRAHALELLTVADAMTAPVVAVNPSSTAAAAAAAVATSGRSFSVVPVVDARGALAGAVRVAALREAVTTGEGAALVATLMQPIAALDSDEPLVHAVVRFNETGARQVAVVEGRQLVGVLALSDLLRAHARATTAIPEATAPRAALNAESLLVPTIEADGATSLHALVDEVARSGVRAVVVTHGDGRRGVVLAEHLHEPASDERLRALLVASDLALVPGEVRPSADLVELIRQTAPGRAEAVLVIGDDERLHGVVTRSAIANALFERYASRVAAP